MTRTEFEASEKVLLGSLEPGTQYWFCSKLAYAVPAKGTLVALGGNETALVIGDGDFLWDFPIKALVLPTGIKTNLDGKIVRRHTTGDKWHRVRLAAGKAGFYVKEDMGRDLSDAQDLPR